MIESIHHHHGQLLALILRADYHAEGIPFFTPNDFSQQPGYMNRSQGYVISPHVHNPVGQNVPCERVTHRLKLITNSVLH